MGRPSGTGQNPKREDARYVGGWIDKKVARKFDTAWHEECVEANRQGKLAPTKIRFLERVIMEGLTNKQHPL